MKLKCSTKKIINVSDWDNFVSKFYKKPYDYQQQDGCQDRGTYSFSVPVKDPIDFENGDIPEIVNGKQMGVSFEAWLKRDPKQPLKNQKYDFELDLWWTRNFYPSIDMIINDLHKKGLLEEGSYMIKIDW